MVDVRRSSGASINGVKIAKIKENKAHLMPQILAAIICSIGHFICGTVNGWSGTSLTKLDQDFQMGATEYSLVASIISYGSLTGSLLSGKAMDLLGRRKLMIITGPLTAFGWILIGFANHMYLLYLGRFVCGLSTGFLLTTCSVYISETCQANLRGRLGSLNSLNMTLGILTSYILGGLCEWRTSAFLCIVPVAIFFVSLFFVPESPYWYLLKEDSEAASNSLKILRGPNYCITDDICDMLSKISNVGFNISYKEFLKRRTLIPMIIALFIQTLQQVCGGNVIMMYTSSIFENAGSSIDPQMATIYTGIAQLAGIIVSMLLIDKFGRRILLSISVGLCGLCITLFGVYYIFLDSSNPWPKWTPLLLLIGLVFFYCIGTRSIPWLIGSELFNTSVRSKANSLIVFYNRVLNLTFIQIFPYTVNAFGEAGVYITYGAASLLCVCGTLIFVPETKGKTLEEIQEYFESKDKKTQVTEEINENRQNNGA